MLQPKFDIHLYVDGACRGNGKEDAIGGWGVYSKDLGIELCGGEPNTTNNKMELTAAIKALEYVAEKHAISIMSGSHNYIIFTDSNYVKQGITEWIHGWKRRDWANVKNVELWKRLDEMQSKVGINNITWQWVKGHSVSEGNNKADELANKGCDGTDLHVEYIKENVIVSKEDFVNYLTNETVCGLIGSKRLGLIEKLYDEYVAGKYTKRLENDYLDKTYLIFMTMNYMLNKGEN